jgi:hypothetical protein
VLQDHPADPLPEGVRAALETFLASP